MYGTTYDNDNCRVVIPLAVILFRDPRIVHSLVLGILVFGGFVQVGEGPPSDLVPYTTFSEAKIYPQTYYSQSGIAGASAAGIAPGGCATVSTPSMAASSMSSIVIVGMTSAAPAMGTSVADRK